MIRLGGFRRSIPFKENDAIFKTNSAGCVASLLHKSYQLGLSYFKMLPRSCSIPCEVLALFLHRIIIFAVQLKCPSVVILRPRVTGSFGAVGAVKAARSTTTPESRKSRPRPCADRARDSAARVATQIRSGHWRPAAFLRRVRKRREDRCDTNRQAHDHIPRVPPPL